MHFCQKICTFGNVLYDKNAYLLILPTPITLNRRIFFDDNMPKIYATKYYSSFASEKRTENKL